MNGLTLYGPFSQLLTMHGLVKAGPLSDKDLNILSNGAILVKGSEVLAVGLFATLKERALSLNAIIDDSAEGLVCLPGLVDPHTHIAFAGSRPGDFAKRLSGMTYLEIAQEGGGIWDTVKATRSCPLEKLVDLIVSRSISANKSGVTTIEVKSGYGLNIEDELKILRAIRAANERISSTLIPTCLAAHIVPADYHGNDESYVDFVLNELFPLVREEGLSQRADIFIEQEAFGMAAARKYMGKLRDQGFHLTAHADQFTTGGSALAVEMKAISADHLEVSQDVDIMRLAQSNTVAVALPGASLGLGTEFAPARKLLDAGACLAIGSDWNPGSAPMGHLLTQASILATMEKLTMAETWSALTYRAARALGRNDIGWLGKGSKADFIAFPCNDYREILYCQGRMEPCIIWIDGKRQEAITRRTF